MRNTADMFIPGVICDKLFHHPMSYGLPNVSTS